MYKNVSIPNLTLSNQNISTLEKILAAPLQLDTALQIRCYLKFCLHLISEQINDFETTPRITGAECCAKRSWA